MLIQMLVSRVGIGLGLVKGGKTCLDWVDEAWSPNADGISIAEEWTLID